MTAIRDNWKANTRPSAPTEAIKRPPPPPLDVKCRVALRQMKQTTKYNERMIALRRLATGGLGKLLDELLTTLCGRIGCARLDLRLDHNPALALRDYDPVTGKFIPDAANPYFLIYRSDADHKIKTHVKGDGALRSDTSERMHRRRLDENRGLRPRKPKKTIQSKPFAPSDKMPRASRKYWGSRAWPKRKMERKMWR